MSKEILVVRGTVSTVEIDTAAMAAYVRFKENTKVARTLSDEKPGTVVTVDLDAAGEVIGVELVGVREFNVKTLLAKTRVEAPNLDESRVRYVTASSVPQVS
jgi:uncharacterized protein YuzE